MAAQDHFESLLLDYDVCSNWGNWAAAGGVTGGRVNRFNIVKQSKDYDAAGDYVRHWLPALRRLPTLKSLFLGYNQIGDRGVASLLAPPTAGVLTSLQLLSLRDNQITDEGCAALASALRGGALPALGGALPVLNVLALWNNPASDEAQQAATAVLQTR